MVAAGFVVFGGHHSCRALDRDGIKLDLAE